MDLPFLILKISPGLIAEPLGIFSTIGVYTFKPISRPSLATNAIIPHAVAAPAISVFIVSMPAGDFNESPPESNNTPLPINAICFLAFVLYSPTKNLGGLSDP